jgi:DNA modification methylase
MIKEQIGLCTLYHGDCLEILPSLIETKADMIFSDPPYGMRKQGIVNDNLNYDDLLAFNKQWILPSFDVLKDGGSWYCWGIEEPLMDIYSEILKPKIKNRELTYRNFITWDKGVGQGQKSQLHRSYVRCNESCLFVTKGNRTIKKMSAKVHFLDELKGIRKSLVTELKNAGINNEVTQKITGSKYVYGHWIATASWRMITEKHYNLLKKYCQENGISAFQKSYNDFRNEYKNALLDWQQNRTYFDNTHENMNCVWRFNYINSMSSEYCGHPAQKPIALCTRAIKTSCPINGIVIDPFMGSGSAGVACQQLGRRYVGIEINSQSFDLACKRIEEAAKQGDLFRVAV